MQNIKFEFNYTVT